MHQRWATEPEINPFKANIAFSYPQKIPENLWFSGIFRGYRNGTLGWNWLNESAESFMLYKNVYLTDHGLRSNPSCFKTSRSIVTSIGVIVDLCVRVDKCYKWIWNTAWNFMIKVPIIKKPVHWFALLISGLVYIW